MMTEHDNDHIDIATKLLNSHDKKVAAAAMRIFSPRISSSSQLNQTQQETEPKEDISMVAFNNGVSLISVKERLITASIKVQRHNLSCPPSGSCPLRDDIPDVVNSSFDYTTMNSIVKESPFNGLNKILRGESETIKKIATPHERLQRSRERNKIHARKTRQRKKVHMQDLEQKAVDLKQNQISIKLRINEKNTANILIAMFSTKCPLDLEKTTADIRIEDLLKRPSESIPDASKIPELPVLVLPGHHNNRKIPGHDNRKRDFHNLNYKEIVVNGQEYPDDGIDYDLLARDRSKCSSTELDRIRRERNRMHAKRTRDRKKRFMDEMERIIRQLENENELLCDHLRTLSEKYQVSSGDTTPLFSPNLGPCHSTTDASTVF